MPNVSMPLGRSSPNRICSKIAYALDSSEFHRSHSPSTSAYVQVSRTPASQNHPRAPTTGVREAPRHEIAGRKGLCFAAAIYGDLRSASVCFREAGTTDARQVDGLTGRGERAPPALGSVSAWRRRSQDVGAASSSERRRRWQTVSGKNGKNGRRCVAVDNAISIMTYRS
jgi:hypothetical protein